MEPDSVRHHFASGECLCDSSSAQCDIEEGDSLYAFPEVYDALRGPDHAQCVYVQGILNELLGETPARVMDPACGPGSWLAHFAAQSIFVGGNDSSGPMVAAARRRLPEDLSEILHGDMRSLEFESGLFDAALELSGTVSLLTHGADVHAFVESLRRNLRLGGIALLAMHFPDRRSQIPSVCWSRAPVEVAGGGRASVIYEILDADPLRGIEWIRRTAHVEHVPECPPFLEDSYALHIWDPNRLEELWPGFRLVAAYCDSESRDGWAKTSLSDLVGERLVALRRE